MSKLIYAADDEKNIRELLEIFLKDAGYEVEMFENGDLLYERFAIKKSDLVILDIMMPGNDGLEICKKIREKSDVPIIMLTAKDTENDFILGMSIGSDDYIMKPFRPTMLLMKIKAIFRRMDYEKKGRTIEIGNIRISSYERKIYDICSGNAVELSMTEFALLAYMANYPGKAISRDELLENVWEIDSDIETRVVDETIRRIRRKINSFDSKVHIETVWGHGYRIVEVEE